MKSTYDKLEFHRGDLTHRYFNIRFFGQMPPDASDFPGGIPGINAHQVVIVWKRLPLNRFSDIIHLSSAGPEAILAGLKLHQQTVPVPWYHKNITKVFYPFTYVSSGLDSDIDETT